MEKSTDQNQEKTIQQMVETEKAKIMSKSAKSGMTFIFAIMAMVILGIMGIGMLIGFFMAKAWMF